MKIEEKIKKVKIPKECRYCNYYHGDIRKNGEGDCYYGLAAGVFADYGCREFSPNCKYIGKNIIWMEPKEG